MGEQDQPDPSPFEVGHQMVAIVRTMSTPTGNKELVAHIGGFLFDSPDDPRLRYNMGDWLTRTDELTWMTPALCMRNLIGLNGIVGQVLTGILDMQVKIELGKRQARGEEPIPPERLPDIILSGLTGVNLDPEQGGGTDVRAEDPSKDPDSDNPAD